MDNLSVQRIWLLPAVWRSSEQLDENNSEWTALELLQSLEARAKTDVAEISKERRRIQNRRNQRAHRLRVKGEEHRSQRVQRPYKVRRWRIAEDDEDTLSQGIFSVTSRGLGITTKRTTLPQSLPTSIETPSSTYDQTRSRRHETAAAPSSNFPLSTDHLLHLIQYNVFRAFISNKRTLNLLLTGWTNLPSAAPSTCPISGPYRDDTTIFPLNPHIPHSLSPTPLQQACIHSLYINFFPFPGVRDNLIRREGSFDQWELLEDLIGELLSFTPTQRPKRTEHTHLAVRDTKPPSSLAADVDDEVTAGRRGLIVWGEPHDMRNWEATPGFISKWSWAVEGCHSLVESSNYWRRLRGEEPLAVDIVGKSGLRQ